MTDYDLTHSGEEVEEEEKNHRAQAAPMPVVQAYRLLVLTDNITTHHTRSSDGGGLESPEPILPVKGRTRTGRGRTSVRGSGISVRMSGGVSTFKR